MDEEFLDGLQLLQLPDRRRAREPLPRPRPLRSGRFIPAAFVRLHDDPRLLWFPGPARSPDPSCLSA